MPKLSAGILLVRITELEPQFLLVHPGGPFWQRRDLGAWSLPKGEYAPEDDALTAALREFEEELGCACPSSALLPLGDVRQAGGKLVTAWCALGDLDVDAISSNTFEIEWPTRSGRRQVFPEVDRAAFFGFTEAGTKIIGGQLPFLERSVAALRQAGHLTTEEPPPSS